MIERAESEYVSYLAFTATPEELAIRALVGLTEPDM